MHTFLIFFGWPMGAVYGNILASLLVAIWVTVQSRSIKAVQAEVRAMHEQHHAEHMDALSLETPGGLAAVMSAAQDAKTAAESATGAVKGLALLSGTATPAATAEAAVKTPMKRAARSRPAPKKEPPAAPEAPVKAAAEPAGMGSRIAPKTTTRRKS